MIFGLVGFPQQEVLYIIELTPIWSDFIRDNIAITVVVVCFLGLGGLIR